MAELMELFLVGPALFMNGAKQSSTEPNFATEFTKFVDKHSMRKPTIDEKFFTMFFVSSLLTLPYSKLLERNSIERIFYKIEDTNLIKLVYPRKVGQSVIMELCTVLFGEHLILESIEYVGVGGTFTKDEIKEIVELFQLEIDTYHKLQLQYRILQMSERVRVWAEVDTIYLHQNFEIAIQSRDISQVSRKLPTFTKLCSEQGETESLLLDPFMLLNDARTPDQIKEISMHLMSNLRLLYAMTADFIPARFQRTSELFSAFVSGAIVMNVQNRFRQSLFIHQPTAHMHLLSLVPHIDKTMNLHTPISMVFVTNHEQFGAAMRLVNSPQHDLMLASPLTNAKLATLVISNFNRLYEDDSIAATLLTVNQPLLSKFIQDYSMLEYSEALLSAEVNNIFHRLGTRNFDIVSNYILGQMLALQPTTGHTINGRYAFTYSDRVLRENVRTYVIVTGNFAFALNIFMDKGLILKSTLLWESDNRKLSPKGKGGRSMKMPEVWESRMIHMNIDVKTGQVRIPKQVSGKLKTLGGELEKFDQFSPYHFIQSAGQSRGNAEFSKYITPHYKHLTTSTELTAFFMGLFSEDYSCLVSTGSDGIHMLSLFNIDSKTIVDQQSIVSELKNHHGEALESGQPSFIQEMNIRINIFSSIYDPDLSIRRTAPAMAIDVTMPTTMLSTAKELMVALRKTYHNAPTWPSALPEECAMNGKRSKRSLMSGCQFEETDAIENKDMYKGYPYEGQANPRKYFGLLTENQAQLFQHIVNDYQYKFWVTAHKTGLIKKLHNVHAISNAVSMGIIYKNIAADLYRGDYMGAITSAAFIGGNYAVAKGFIFLSQKKYFQNSKALGFISPVLRRSAPFLRRFAAGYNLYSLYKSANSYAKNRDTMSLVDVIESSTFLVADIGELLMELAGMETLLSIFGPIGAAATALVFVGAEVYRAHELLKPYDQTLHLSLADKVLDGTYSFFTGEVDSAVKDEADEKLVNQKLASMASKYLLDHKDILIYIFPIYMSINGQQIIAEDNVIDLHQQQDIKWPQVLPDAQKLNTGTGILCFTSEETEWSDHVSHATSFEKFRHYWDSFWEMAADTFRSKHPSYRCDNAFGLVNKNVTEGKVLIDLQDGNDLAAGFNKHEHIYMIGDGKKTILSPSGDLSTFVFIGNLTSGSVFNNGSGTADFSSYAQNLSKPMSIKMFGRKAVIQTKCGMLLTLVNVSNIIGRKDKQDNITASCFLNTFNSNGADRENVDSLIIPDQLCSYNMTIFGSDSIEIKNHATIGSFRYFLTLDAGSALIDMTNSPLAEHEIFLLDWNIMDLDELYYEKGCIFVVYWTAYSKICKEDPRKLTFRFSNGFNLKVSKDGAMHAFGAVRNVSDSQIMALYDLSQKFEILFNIKCLDTNTSILISHTSSGQTGAHIPVVLSNDPNSNHSLLIGGANENTFVMDQVLNSAVTDIIISVLNENSLHNTIDLTSFVGKDISYTIEKSHEDLILTIIQNSSQVEKTGSIVFTIKVNKCFENDLHKRFTIVLNSPMSIEVTDSDLVILIPLPINVDTSETPVTIIKKSHIEPGLQIHINQRVWAWSVYRTNRNLIWSALVEDNSDILWIIFNDFYTIFDESRIYIRILFDDRTFELSWNNTRPDDVQMLKSMLLSLKQP